MCFIRNEDDTKLITFISDSAVGVTTPESQRKYYVKHITVGVKLH